MTTKRTMQEEKPICLVLDEIDGSPAVAPAPLSMPLNGRAHRFEACVNWLVSLVKGSSEGSKKSAKIALKRPIICICNDLSLIPSRLPFSTLPHAFSW